MLFCVVVQYAVDKCEYWRLADSNNKPPGLLGWWPSKSVVSGAQVDVSSCKFASLLQVVPKCGDAFTTYDLTYDVYIAVKGKRL